MAALAVMVAAVWIWPGCNAVSGKQGVIEIQKRTRIETVAEQNAEVIRNAAVAIENRQTVAASQPVAASVGGVHLGGGQTNNTGTDPWLYRGTVWGAIGGAFLLSAWFARWQARKHGYDSGRNRRLKREQSPSNAGPEPAELYGRGHPKNLSRPQSSTRPWAAGPPPHLAKPPPPPAPPPPPKNETTSKGMDPRDAIRARDEIVKYNLAAFGLTQDPLCLRDALMEASEVLGKIAFDLKTTQQGSDLVMITMHPRILERVRNAYHGLNRCVVGGGLTCRA